MSAARDEVLREARHWAAVLRRSGYPEAEVAPEYCVGGDITGGYFTRTVSVWAGSHKPESVPPTIAKAFAVAISKLNPTKKD